MGTHTELHHQDFYAWLAVTADLLRAGKWQEIDALTLAEELDAVRAQERREALRRLRRLMQHLLKWQYQPRRGRPATRGVRRSGTQRAALADMLEESPTMDRELAALLRRGYPLACQWASDDTHVPLATFPQTPPWTLEQVLDANFWPDASQDSSTTSRP